MGYEPTRASPILQLELPSTSTFSRSSRVVSRVLDTVQDAKDEQEFRKRNIATHGSVFFRSQLPQTETKYPRAISWRCLEGNTVLELRSIDISRSVTIPKDASHALRIVFPYPIQTSSVALADSTEDNIISVFVATRGNELYTLSLKPSYFMSRTISTDAGDRWYKVSRPSAVNTNSFHRLVALSSLLLLVSATDGRLMCLSRKQGEDGSLWKEAGYDEEEWNSSFRSLLPWQAKNTLRFEGSTLSHRTVHAAAISPDNQHILTVGLDHYLRALSVSRRKTTCSRDLLNYHRSEEQSTRYTIDPRTPNNLAVFECKTVGPSRYCAMTVSPFESGRFKIWIVNDADSEDGITDAFEETGLHMPDPGDGALWTFSDFAVQANADMKQLEIWVLLRLNRRYKLYNHRFDDFASIGEEWAHGWTCTMVDSSKHEPTNEPPVASGSGHSDLSSRWINHIIRSDQAPAKVLETALAMYTQGRDTKRGKMPKIPLVEQIASLVGSQTQTQTTHATVSDYEKLEQRLGIEWNHFWNVVKDLDGLRWEPLSLSLDRQYEMPWISFADGSAPIRQCTEIEILSHNSPDLIKRGVSPGLQTLIASDERRTPTHAQEQQALLIELGAMLRSSLSDETKALGASLMLEEIWADPLGTPAARMQDFAQTCGLAEDISERLHHELLHMFDSKKGPNGLTTAVFLSMLEHLSPLRASHSDKLSTDFGVRAIVRGAQDMVALHLRVLQDLIYLVVYLEVEVDREAYPMKHLETDAVFMALLDQLRTAQLAHWLASNSRSPVMSKVRGSEASDSFSQSTVLEDLFARDIKPHDEGGMSQSATFTTSIRDLLVWCAGGNSMSVEKALVTIQCDLLKNNNIALASSFKMFQPESPWSIYIQGRLALICGEYSDAAECFQEAAFGLCKSWLAGSAYLKTDQTAQLGRDRLHRSTNYLRHLCLIR